MNVGAKQGRQLHRAGEVVDVVRFRVDAGDRCGIKKFDQAFNGTGGNIPSIHPAGKGQHERGLLQFRLVENFK